MKIERARAYLGANVIAAAPLVHFVVRIDGNDRWPPGAEGARCSERLLRLLPGLAGHPGEAPNESFAARLARPPAMPLPWLAAEVASALLTGLSGSRKPAGARPDKLAGRHHFFFGYDDPDVGLLAGHAAIALVLSLLPTALRPASAAPEDPAALLRRFQQRAASIALDQTLAALTREAARRGIPWQVLDRPRRIVELGQGRHRRRLRETVTDRTSAIATWLQNDKAATNRLLSQRHFPVPRQALVAQAEEAVQQARRIGFPVAVKPLNLGKGVGVSLGLSDDAGVRTAFALARRHSEQVIVESFIAGRDYRVLVVDGRMVAAANRIPAAVIGDGASSIIRLVEAVNRDPERGRGFTRLMNRIELDAQADEMLHRRGLTRDSVPAAGETIYLRGTANISTGGTALDVTDVVHPDNRSMLERCARVMGLDVAGIDFISPDIARSYREVGGAICEVNSSPGLRPHQVAARVPGARPRDVVGPIVDLLFPGGSDGRVPTAAITGTNGKTTTSRMLARILRESGTEIGVCTVGLVTTHGVTIGDVLVAKGDFSGGTGARIVLGDPLVEAAVLETARGGIITGGLAFDWCNVGAVLNVADDHLGLQGVDSLDELAAVKRCVAQAARDLVVLNADDPRCLAMAGLKPAERTCLFTLDARHPALAAHLASGGRAVVPESRDGAETLVLRHGAAAEPLIAVAAIPATLGGAARHNVQNAMAAAALALGLGLSPGGVAAGLAAFRGDHADNPGRLNVYDGLPFKVIFDSAHNPAGIAVLCAALRALPVSGRRICVLSGIGYRHGHHIAEIARLVAGQFDFIICSRRETLPDYAEVVRDFPLEEVPQRVAAALRAEGVPPDHLEVIDLDTEAVDRGLAMAREGDLLVLLTGLVEWTWDRTLHFAEGRSLEPSAATQRQQT
ncbi:MAG TPA: Mur ligase family protein [Kiloniellaceae bacterium]|nr:Mur ligase family protein [Kiloniellaceae bacterium]